MPATWKKVREFFWPSMGPKRYAAYLARRTQRLRASSHAVAAGVASASWGAGVSCSAIRKRSRR